MTAPPTNVPNERTIDQAVEDAVANAMPYPSLIAAAIIDGVEASFPAREDIEQAIRDGVYAAVADHLAKNGLAAPVLSRAA